MLLTELEEKLRVKIARWKNGMEEKASDKIENTLVR
jgi:hypothetical protein